MTMLINEYRLTPIEPKARTFLEEEMDKFFFLVKVQKFQKNLSLNEFNLNLSAY